MLFVFVCVGCGLCCIEFNICVVVIIGLFKVLYFLIKVFWIIGIFFVGILIFMLL